MAAVTAPLVAAGLPADIGAQSPTPYFLPSCAQPAPRTCGFSRFAAGANPLPAAIRDWNCERSGGSVAIPSVYPEFGGWSRPFEISARPASGCRKSGYRQSGEVRGS